MLYQRERDRILYENSVTVNENAPLAIQKQGEVVSCLAQLSSVLSRGLNMPYRIPSTNDAKAVPPTSRPKANYTEGTPQIPPSGPSPPARGEDLQAEGSNDRKRMEE
jgi:hypothetical protein